MVAPILIRQPTTSLSLEGKTSGLIGIKRRSDHWFLDKLYLLPRYQSRGSAAI